MSKTSINKQLIYNRRDRPVQTEKKQFLRTKLLYYSELALKSIDFSRAENVDQLNKFKSLKSKMIAEKLVVNLIITTERKRNLNLGSALAALRLDYMAHSKEEETKAVLFRRVRKLNYIFHKCSKKTNDKPRMPLSKAFLRWRVKANRLLLQTCVEKLACNHKVKKETVIWRLKKLVTEKQTFRKMKYNEAMKNFAITFKKAEKRTELNFKNFFFYSLCLITAKNQREEVTQKKQRFFDLINKKMGFKMNSTVDAIARKNPKRRLLNDIVKVAQKKNEYCLNKLRMLVKRQKLTTAYRFYDLITKMLGKNTKTAIKSVAEHNPKKKLLDMFSNKFYANLRKYLFILKRKAQLLKNRDTMLEGYGKLIEDIILRNRKKNSFNTVFNYSVNKENFLKLRDFFDSCDENNGKRDMKAMLEKLKQNMGSKREGIKNNLVQTMFVRQERKAFNSFNKLSGFAVSSRRKEKELVQGLFNGYRNKLAQSMDILITNKFIMESKDSEKDKLQNLLKIVFMVEQKKKDNTDKTFSLIKTTADEKTRATTRMSLCLKRGLFSQRNQLFKCLIEHNNEEQRKEEHLEFLSRVIASTENRKNSELKRLFFRKCMGNQKRLELFGSRLNRLVNLNDANAKRDVVNQFRMALLEDKLRAKEQDYQIYLKRRALSRINLATVIKQKDCFYTLQRSAQNTNLKLSKLLNFIKERTIAKKQKTFDLLINFRNMHSLLGETEIKKLHLSRFIQLLVRIESSKKKSFFQSISFVQAQDRFIANFLKKYLVMASLQKMNIGLKVLMKNYKNHQLKHFNQLISKSSTLESNMKMKYQKQLLSHIFNHSLAGRVRNDMYKRGLDGLKDNRDKIKTIDNFIGRTFMPKTNNQLNQGLGLLKENKLKSDLRQSSDEVNTMKLMRIVERMVNRRKKETFSDFKIKFYYTNERLRAFKNILDIKNKLIFEQVLTLLKRNRRRISIKQKNIATLRINRLLSSKYNDSQKKIFDLKKNSNKLQKLFFSVLVSKTSTSLSLVLNRLQYNKLQKKIEEVKLKKLFSDLSMNNTTKKLTILNQLSLNTIAEKSSSELTSTFASGYKLVKRGIFGDLIKLGTQVRKDHFIKQYKTYAVKYMINANIRKKKDFFNLLRNYKNQKLYNAKKLKRVLYNSHRRIKRYSLRFLQAFSNYDRKTKQNFRSAFNILTKLTDTKKEEVAKIIMTNLIRNSNKEIRQKYVLSLLFSNLNYSRQLCFNIIRENAVFIQERYKHDQMNNLWKWFVDNKSQNKNNKKAFGCLSLRSEPLKVFNMCERVLTANKGKALEGLSLIRNHKNRLEDREKYLIKDLIKKFKIGTTQKMTRVLEKLKAGGKMEKTRQSFVKILLRGFIFSQDRKKAACFRFLKDPFWKRDIKQRAWRMMDKSFNKLQNKLKQSAFRKLIPYSDKYKNRVLYGMLETLVTKLQAKKSNIYFKLREKGLDETMTKDLDKYMALTKITALGNKEVSRVYYLSFYKLLSLLNSENVPKRRLSDKISMLNGYLKEKQRKERKLQRLAAYTKPQRKNSKTQLEHENIDIIKNNKALNTQNYNIKQSKKYLLGQIKLHENTINKIRKENEQITKEKEDLVIKEQEMLKFNKKLNDEIIKLEEERGKDPEANANSRRFQIQQSNFNYSISTNFETGRRDSNQPNPLDEIFDELERLNKEKEELEERLNDVYKEREMIEDELERIENEHDKYERDIKRLEQDNSHLNNEIEHFKNEQKLLEQRNKELQNKNLDLLSQIRKLKEEIQKLDMTIKELEDDLIEMDTDKIRLKELINDARTKNKFLQNEFDYEKELHDKKEREINKYKNHNKDMEENSKALLEENKYLEREMEKLEFYNESLEQTRFQSESKKARFKDDNEFLSSQRKVQMEEQDNLMKDFSSEKIDKRRLSLQNDKLSSILQKMKIIDDNIETNNAKIGEEDKSLRKLDGNYMENKNELSMKQWKIDNNKQLIRRNNEMIQENDLKIKEFDKDKAVHEDKLNKISESIENNEQIIADNKKQIDEIEQKIVNTKQEINDKFEELQKKKDLLNKLKIELDKNNYHIQSNIDLMARNEEKQKTLEEEIKKNEAEMKEKQNKLNEFNSMISEKKLKIQNLDTQYRRRQKEIERNDNNFKNESEDIKKKQNLPSNFGWADNEIAHQPSQKRQMALNNFKQDLEHIGQNKDLLENKMQMVPEERIAEIKEQIKKNENFLSEAQKIISQKAYKIERNNEELNKAEEAIKVTSYKIKEYDDQLATNNALIMQGNTQLQVNTKKIDEQKDLILRNYDEIKNINKLLQELTDNKNRSVVMESGSPQLHSKIFDKSKLDVSMFDNYAQQNKIDFIGATISAIQPMGRDSGKASKTVVSRLLAKNLKEVINRKMRGVFGVIKTNFRQRRRLNQILTIESSTSHFFPQNELAIQKEVYAKKYTKLFNALFTISSNKLNDNYHHLKLIVHIKMLKMYLNSLFRWKAQNMEYNHRKELVRMKTRRHQLPLFLIQKVRRLKADVFNNMLITVEQNKLRSFYTKLLPVIVNADNNYKQNLRNVLLYWHEIKDENKWFIKILRNMIQKSALEPQLALWRMKMYRPPTLFISPKVKLGFSQLHKFFINKREMILMKAIWNLEKYNVELDDSLGFGSNTSNKRNVRALPDDDSLQFSTEEKDNQSQSLEFSEVENRRSNESNKQKDIKDYLKKLFLKTLVSNAKKEKAYCFHRLLYFTLKLKKNDGTMEMSRLGNTLSPKGSMGQNREDVNQMNETIEMLMDENYKSKVELERKEKVIKELEEKIATRKENTKFLKHHYIYSYLNKIESIMAKRNGIALNNVVGQLKYN